MIATCSRHSLGVIKMTPPSTPAMHQGALGRPGGAGLSEWAGCLMGEVGFTGRGWDAGSHRVTRATKAPPPFSRIPRIPEVPDALKLPAVPSEHDGERHGRLAASPSPSPSYATSPPGPSMHAACTRTSVTRACSSQSSSTPADSVHLVPYDKVQSRVYRQQVAQAVEITRVKALRVRVDQRLVGRGQGGAGASSARCASWRRRNRPRCRAAFSVVA
jgi:hypothetical protein